MEELKAESYRRTISESNILSINIETYKHNKKQVLHSLEMRENAREIKMA